MALEEKGRGQTTVADKNVYPVADYEMNIRDYVVRPSADVITGPFTLTLPPVGKAKGKFYSVVCRNADAVNTITIEDNNSDSECWNGDFVMNGKCDKALFYSDGMAWLEATDLAVHTGTAAPTTAAPTTASPTTAAPTTAVPTTQAPE